MILLLKLIVFIFVYSIFWSRSTLSIMLFTEKFCLWVFCLFFLFIFFRILTVFFWFGVVFLTFMFTFFINSIITLCRSRASDGLTWRFYMYGDTLWSLLFFLIVISGLFIVCRILRLLWFLLLSILIILNRIRILYHLLFCIFSLSAFCWSIAEIKRKEVCHKQWCV